MAGADSGSGLLLTGLRALGRPAAPQGRGRWLNLILATAVALTSLGMGAWGLTRPTPSEDESATVLAMSRDFGQILALLQGSDAPLVPYYLAVRATWMMTPVLGALTVARLVSVVASAVAVVVLYSFVSRRAGLGAGFVAGVLLATLPGFSRYAQEARPYSVFVLLTVVVWVLWDRWRILTVTDGSGAESRARGAWFGLALGSSLTVQLFSVFQWPGLVLAELTTLGLDRRARLRRAMGTIVVMGLALAVVAVPVGYSALHGTGPQAPYQPRFLHYLQFAFFMTATPAPSLAIAVPVVIAIFAAFIPRGFGRRYRDVVRICLIWWLVPLAFAWAIALVRLQLLRPRYWLAALPPVAALAAIGLAVVAEWVVRWVGAVRWPASLPWLRALATATALTTLLVVPAVVYLQEIRAPHQAIRKESGHGIELKQALRLVDRLLDAGGDRPVLFSPGTMAAVVMAASPSRGESNPLYDIDPWGTSIWPVRRSDEAVQASLVGVDRLVWLREKVDDIPPVEGPDQLAGSGFEVSTVQEAGDWWVCELQR